MPIDHRECDCCDAEDERRQLNQEENQYRIGSPFDDVARAQDRL